MTPSFAIESESIVCTTPDGWELRGEARLPAEPKAAAVLAHAMMVNRRTMDRPRGSGLASALAARGIATFVFDLRGHGESRPTVREGASYTYDAFPNRDIPAIVGYARTRLPRLPLAVVGHSLGAHAALFAAGLHPAAAPEGVVSVAGNVWLPSLEPSAARRAAKGATFRAWLAAATVMGRWDPRAFGLGTDAEPLAYIQQFVGAWREDRFASEDGRIDYLAALGRVRAPVLSIASEGDKLLAHPEAVAAMLARITHAEVTARVIRAADVGGPAPDHMGLVMWPRSRPVWDAIAAWILALPAPALDKYVTERPSE